MKKKWPTQVHQTSAVGVASHRGTFTPKGLSRAWVQAQGFIFECNERGDRWRAGGFTCYQRELGWRAGGGCQPGSGWYPAMARELGESSVGERRAAQGSTAHGTHPVDNALDRHNGGLQEEVEEPAEVRGQRPRDPHGAQQPHELVAQAAPEEGGVHAHQAAAAGEGGGG